MKIFRNNKTTTNETESIVSNQLSQLNEKEQYFLGLMKKADTTNRPIEELLALSYLTQHKNPKIRQQRTFAKLHELLDSSENVELKKIKEMLSS